MQTIGRFEYVDFSDGPQKVPAKIDTGAYRSSIHVKDIELVEGDKPILKFSISDHPLHPDDMVVETSDFGFTIVKSSNGQRQKRYTVELEINIAGFDKFKTSFTLADRSNNFFPVLIGREALRDRFIVDVARTGVDKNMLKQAIAYESKGDTGD